MDDSLLGVSIFDDASRKFRTLLQVAILDAAPATHIPEIFEVFGLEYFLKFLDVFSGTTIKVPSLKALEDSVRDVSIYVILKRADPGTRSKIVKSLAEDYRISAGIVRRIFVAMEEKMQHYDV